MNAKRNDVPAADFQSPVTAFAESPLGGTLLKVLAEGSAANRAIADYLLRNQIRVTAWGIEELAEHCKVSTASISRFARDIGFKNYSAMRNEVALTLQSVLQPVEKLRNNIGRPAGGTHPALESLEYAAANLNACKQSLDAAQLDAIVSALSKARTVYVMGFGLSSQLAAMLALHLQPFCQHVIDVAGQGGTEIAAGHLAHITERDVLVVISFPRYSLDVIRLTGFARERNACIVSITDSPASALAGLATHAVYAQSEHPVLPSSATAAMAIIEALVVALMVSNKENVAKAARLTDALSAWLYGPDAGAGQRRPSRSSGD
ncbi:MurR/RpiR family transcriptional regulator [Massilia sp. PAMC28688]|uniref:MurR/RpiR family transcriptional regulator n=1 Tax=Massilia sp. PAMC28688 TaxID=2861283 RepID=UPI001C639A0B|nr:MurR/RpiR family transcriptional regulator [Massilia sp. PAMC28688]QYF94856.1 MurR/RpiR family transcriptional regulator [Massilia sp. PAMC28688]